MIQIAPSYPKKFDDFIIPFKDIWNNFYIHLFPCANIYNVAYSKQR